MPSKKRLLRRAKPYGEDLTHMVLLRLHESHWERLNKLAATRDQYASTYLRDLLERHLNSAKVA